MIVKFKTLSIRLKLGLKVFFVTCILVTLLDIIVNKHGAHWWDFFGFYSLYGFAACVMLVLIATWMRKIVRRDDDYYD